MNIFVLFDCVQLILYQELNMVFGLRCLIYVSNPRQPPTQIHLTTEQAGSRSLNSLPLNGGFSVGARTRNRRLTVKHTKHSATQCLVTQL